MKKNSCGEKLFLSTLSFSKIELGTQVLKIFIHQSVDETENGVKTMGSLNAS